MKKSYLLSTLLLLATMLFLLSSSTKSFAVIPTNITGNYIVNYPGDYCSGTCTIQPGATLTINTGATVTFTSDIIIEGHGTLKLESGAIVKIAAGKRILVHGYSGGASIQGIAGGKIVADDALFTSASSGTFWSGIETDRGDGINFLREGHVTLNYCTVENATVAIRNYDSGNPIINATSGGRLYALFTTFKNNLRALEIYNDISSPNVPDPSSSIGLDWGGLFQYCDFIHSNDFTPTPYPQDMVYLNNSKNVTFFSCNFKGNTTVFPLACTGIQAVNSSMRLQPYFGNPNAPRCEFSNLKTGVAVTNALQADRIPLIVGTDFYCTYGVNLSGCLDPWVMGCNFQVDNNPTYFGIYLNNCTGYRIEGNTFKSHPVGGPSIVVKNSGAAYNEIYRNKVIPYPVGSAIGIQAIGKNSDASHMSGLKILCNSLSGYFDGYEISIIKNPVTLLTNNGISNFQYTYQNYQQTSLITSAGNLFNFTENPDPSYPYPNYYIGPNTNNTAQFMYRYNYAIALENPVHRNFPNTLNAAANTCPLHNAGAPPAPVHYVPFLVQLSALENQIRVIKASSELNKGDSINLDRLFAAHAKLIDSIVGYYQYMNLTDSIDYTDSIAMVYEHVNEGYQYKFYLASTYLNLNRYDDAINLLNAIPSGYDLDSDEARDISNISVLYVTLKWLHEHNGNWSEMPEELKLPVYQYEEESPLFAGAIARSLFSPV